jgi:dolichol-phosphate mannosyltransferase
MAYYADTTDLKGIITVDSDGQHTVEDVGKIASAMSEHPDSLILGARDFNEGGVPWKSRFGNKCTVVALKLFIGGNISDTQTGLRGIPNSLIKRFSTLPGDRFEYETVMLIDAIKSDTDIREVSIKTVYINENSETHFHPVKDSLKIYKVILGTFFKYILSSLSSFLVDYGIFCAIIAILARLGHAKTQSVWIATVIARICSSLFNYTVNKKIVFGSSRGMETLLQYYILCLAQMAASAGFVSLMAKGGFPVQIAKIIVDTILFVVSFKIQNRYIFKKEH